MIGFKDLVPSASEVLAGIPFHDNSLTPLVCMENGHFWNIFLFSV